MIYIYKPNSEWHKRSDLTENKQYDCCITLQSLIRNDEWNGLMVYSSDGIYYKLINDLGKEIEVHESHLIPLDKWRSNKLNELGIWTYK
jgi:hypothetical protein